MLSTLRLAPGLVHIVPKMGNLCGRTVHCRSYLNCFPMVCKFTKSQQMQKVLPSTSAVISAKNGEVWTCMDQKRYYSDSKLQTALAIIKDLKHVTSSPKPALTLGVSGVIPFLASPFYMMMTGTYLAGLAYSQVAYGACILSFIGAVRWGMTLSDDSIVKPNWVNLGYSVTPALIAWLALLMPTPFALTTLMVGLGGAAYMDLTMYGYPSWFKALRFFLSLAAILSLWTTLMCMAIFPRKAKKKEKSSQKKAMEVSKPDDSKQLMTSIPLEVKEEKIIEEPTTIKEGGLHTAPAGALADPSKIHKD